MRTNVLARLGAASTRMANEQGRLLFQLIHDRILSGNSCL
jgi:hypothetical protein